MKLTKRIFALVLALVLALALGTVAFAADETTYTLTIKPNSNDKAEHTYEAYQIFKGDLFEKDGKKILSNIVWGANIDKDNTTTMTALAAAINALRDSTAEGYVALTASSSAAEFADALSELGAADDSVTAQAVADAFGAALSGSPVATGSAAIGGLEAGYYIVKDQDGSLNGKEDAAYTRYILQVLSDVEIGAKSEVPHVDKKIKEGEKLVNANNASIGDKIPYVVTSAVPDMTGYEKYFFVLNDTMSKGLTFNDDVAITIGETELGEDDFTVTSSVDADTGVTTIKIVLKNFIQYKEQKGAAITVTYSATLNEDADLTETGNVNEVTLTYSNNPNYDYEGENEPGSDEPTGVTPKSTTKTFTTGIELIKVDEEGNTLTGAKFKIGGEGVVVTLINQEVYKEDANGTWYMLKDGTYTKTAPTDDTKDSYDSTEKKYTKVTEVVEDTKTQSIVAEGYVDEDGHLTFVGLAAGTYTITELVAPDGFNLLKDAITVVITGDMDDTAMTCHWSATADGKDISQNSAHLFEITVENKSGSELPSTGGIGTTLFYVLGGLMAVGAGVVLVARKRVAED